MNYEDTLKIVHSFADKAGQVVDEGIKPVVAALMMHGYQTSASCEGHPERSELCYPFVILNFPEPEDEWDESERPKWLLKNIEQQKKLAEDLESFYKIHTPPFFNARLVINSFGAGIAELRSFGAEFIELEENKAETHQTYLDELRAFGEFLREK